MMIEQSGSVDLVTPDCIAGGVGLVDRREVCGLLAVLEATRAIQLAQGALSAVMEKIGHETADANQRTVILAARIYHSPIATGVLRHRLWMEIGTALGPTDLLPLSVRKAREAASGIGLLAAARLAPGLQAADAEGGSASWGGRLLGGAMLLASRLSHGNDKTLPSFPDIVAAELAALLQGMGNADVLKQMDPSIADAIRTGQSAMLKAAASGGGWTAFAAAVGSAGFAPYLFAAQLSAFLPFVSGPALVSFLAVLINPVTVVAGVAAIGTWAVQGQANAVRSTVASRLAVLMAVRGMAQTAEGIAGLVSAVREVSSKSARELPHLSREQFERLWAKGEFIERKLGQRLPPAHRNAPGSWSQVLRPDAGHDVRDTIYTGGLTAADMLFHAMAIDQDVLKAADFSRLLQLENPLDLAAHISSFATKGAQVSLRGYTAERFVLSQLVEQGHDAELPLTSNMAGFDLLVDGYPVQVKCGASLGLLREHFSKYPDIPVIADNKLAALAEEAGLPWSHLVTTLDGFDLDTIEDVVSRTLDAADDLAAPDLPFFAFIVGLGRGASKAAKGEIPLGDVPAWVVINLTVKGALTTAGKLGGAWIGLLAIGPAGALVLGPALGVAALLGTGKVHRVVERAVHSEWHARVLNVAAELRVHLVSALEQQALQLVRRQTRIDSATDTVGDDLADWLRARALDDAVAALETLHGLPVATDAASATELLVHGAALARFDLNLAAAQTALVTELGSKPSLGESAQRLWGRAASAFEERRARKT